MVRSRLQLWRQILRIRKRRKVSLFARWFLSAFGLAPVLAACLVLPSTSLEDGVVLTTDHFTRLNMANNAGI